MPGEVIDGLASVQDAMRRSIPERLRYVRPEGIHLTLKFLGNVEAQRVGAITEALVEAIEPFELRVQINTLGSFGGARTRVVWAGLSGDIQALAALAGRVDVALEPIGFAREQRKFDPHLTLARVPDEASAEQRRRLGEFVRSYKFTPLGPILVSEVVLMRSRLGAGGATYERLVSLPLNQGKTS